MIKTPMHAAVDRAVPRADDPSDDTPLLTVIVPVYNEVATISELLARVISAPYSKQVIVVDDGSTDGTTEALREWQDDPRFTLLRHEVNRGAGAAIQSALPHSRGRFTIIQDADLEYNPEDYHRLIEPLLAEKARAVFGSRYMPETPREPLWKRVKDAFRAMKARVRNAMKSVARGVANVLKFVWRLITLDWKALAAPATDAKVHVAKGAGLPPLRQKRRMQPWGLRRVGAAVLQFTARLLFRARLSDVAASFKAFSTELLRKLDLQCERYEFGPEVAAKLCRAGEKIVEVPVRYERRVGRRSRIFERFARRPDADASRSLGRKHIVEKHRWSDGPHALNTLWKWRHWLPQVPDPKRIPALAPAANVPALTTKVDEPVPAGVGADLDHWAEEDANRSDFDEAVWNIPRRKTAAEERRESFVERMLAASAEARQNRQFVAAAWAAAAAFEPRLLWERFVAPEPTPKTSGDSEETDKAKDWEHWALTDLLLLLAIVNIGLVLLVTLVPQFSSWIGVVLGVLASAVTFRTTPAGRFTFDKCNQAFVVLTVLLICPMFPSAWVWRDRTMLILAALALLVGLGRLISKGVRRLDRNLLDAVGILAIFFAGLHVASPDRRAFELLILLTSVTLFLGVHRKRKMRRLSDNALLVVAVIGIFLAVVFLYLFPINFAVFLANLVAATPIQGASTLERLLVVPMGHRGGTGGGRCRPACESREEGHGLRTTRWRFWLPVSGIDLVLMGVVLTFIAVSGAILWLSPKWWSNYIDMLDVRIWTPGKVVVLGIVVMQSLMVIRLWPKRK